MDNEFGFDFDDDITGVMLTRAGSKPNTLLTVMPDPFGGGVFAVIWQFPPGEENPIGTIRPFSSLELAMTWLMECDINP